MFRNKLSKLVAVAILMAFFTNTLSAVAVAEQAENAYNVDGEIYYESFYNDSNQYVEVEIRQLSNGNITKIFLDGVLTQIATADYSADVVSLQYVDSTSPAMIASSAMEQSYKISDLIRDIEVQATRNISVSSYDMEDWTLYESYPPTPLIDGAKGCDLYVRNYDEEPDLHRYNDKYVNFDAGTAISVIASVLSVFLTGEVTVKALVIAFGSAIVADVISKAIDGDICFSTKKILYAPIVGGKWIFKDAYITQRWIITKDNLTGTENFELDVESYQSNRGAYPNEIAVNAQIEEVSMSS